MWTRVILDGGDGEEWELSRGAAEYSSARWRVYRVHGRRTHRNPTGEIWRGMRNSEVLRANQRVRSWLSRHAAMGALEELARLGL